MLGRYVLRRLVFLVPQMLGIVTVVFVVMRVLPADPVGIAVGPAYNPETVRKVTERMGLDKPIIVQYGLFLRNISQGDFGSSFWTGRPVLSDFADRLPATLEFTTVSILLAGLLGIPAGVASALSRGRLPDRVISGVTALALGVPVFWLGLLFVFVFFYLLGWAPPPIGRLSLSITPPDTVTGFLAIDSVLDGNWQALVSSLQHLALPVLTLFWIPLAPIVKVTRAATLETSQSDYVEFSRLMGLPPLRTWLYAVRGALLPVITIMGVLYSLSIGWSVLVENVFSWPGIGKYALDSIVRSDYAPIQAFVVLTTAFTIVVNMVADVLYIVIDPRIRYK